MPTVVVNNVAIHYADAGQGVPLVLLHGVGGSHEMWLPVVPDLARAWRVIAPDQRGHGASDKPRGQYTIRLLAEDCLALMDALGVDRAHVMGLSMGGAVAMQLTVDVPRRVRSLILVDTWAHPHPDFLGMLRQRLDALAEGGLAAYAEKAIPQVFSPTFVATHPEAMTQYRARVARADPDSLRSAIGACMRHDMRGALARIEVPTLVITGSDDRLVPPFHAEYLARAIPNAALVVVEGSAHIPHLEAPTRFLRAVRDFLGAVEQRESS